MTGIRYVWRDLDALPVQETGEPVDEGMRKKGIPEEEACM